MNETKQIMKNNDTVVSPVKFWGTITLGGLLTLVGGYFAIVMYRTATLVSYIGLAVFLLTLLSAVTSIVLVIRRQRELGLKLVFYTMLGMGVTVIALFQGRTTTASLSIFTISIIAILWLFPSQSRRWYFAVTLAAMIMMWTFEWINPPWRILVQAATVGPAAVVVFISILGVIAVIQARKVVDTGFHSSFWANLSLARKLLFAFGALFIFGLVIAASGLFGLNRVQSAYEDTDRKSVV